MSNDFFLNMRLVGFTRVEGRDDYDLDCTIFELIDNQGRKSILTVPQHDLDNCTGPKEAAALLLRLHLEQVAPDDPGRVQTPPG